MKMMRLMLKVVVEVVVKMVVMMKKKRENFTTRASQREIRD